MHFGMYQSAQGLLHKGLPLVSELSVKHKGYNLMLVGHSLGAGVAALISHMINTRCGREVLQR